MQLDSTGVSISGDPLIPGVNWFLDTNKGVDTGATAKLIVTQTTILQGSAAQAKDECGRLVPGVTLADTLSIFARDSFFCRKRIGHDTVFTRYQLPVNKNF